MKILQGKSRGDFLEDWCNSYMTAFAKGEKQSLAHDESFHTYLALRACSPQLSHSSQPSGETGGRSAKFPPPDIRDPRSEMQDVHKWQVIDVTAFHFDPSSDRQKEGILPLC